MKSGLFVAVLAVCVSGCASLPLPWRKKAEVPASVTPRREDVVAHPGFIKPQPGKSASVWSEALEERGTRIVISTQGRSLWLMRDTTVVFKAPIAVGRSKKLVYKGKEYDFTTPVGERKVVRKATSPLWTPPDWHYFEIAQERGVEPVFLKKSSKVTLGDSTRIEVRQNQVGRVNRMGNFWPFTPGKEIIFDGKVFVPPHGTEQRKVPEVLGTHKLEMGSGYLIHGTNEEGSIGDAVSHGCIRMYNEDVAELYAAVPVGTQVFIY
ncbi:MAG: L,D-transpeptidase [Gemmatimonadota bacterium]